MLRHYGVGDQFPPRGSLMDKLLPIDDSAEYLGGISTNTVWAWLQNGRLKRTKVGRRTMIRQSELDRLIEEDNREEERKESEDIPPQATPKQLGNTEIPATPGKPEEKTPRPPIDYRKFKW
jgi:excisionase family DNA binding protein